MTEQREDRLAERLNEWAFRFDDGFIALHGEPSGSPASILAEAAERVQELERAAKEASVQLPWIAEGVRNQSRDKAWVGLVTARLDALALSFATALGLDAADREPPA